jgi:predicted nucleic acid-binding protein
MTFVLVDSNVLIDLFQGGSIAGWSRAKLAELGAQDRTLALNQIVWSEIGLRFDTERDLERALAGLPIERLSLTFEAAFFAGSAHARYRRSGGTRERTLPDFLVGAHAQATGSAVLTRDPARYRTYFPTVEIIAPDTHP